MQRVLTPNLVASPGLGDHIGRREVNHRYRCVFGWRGSYSEASVCGCEEQRVDRLKRIASVPYMLDIHLQARSDSMSFRLLPADVIGLPHVLTS